MGGRVKRPDIARYGPPFIAGVAAACVIGLLHVVLPTYLKELDLRISDRMHQLRGPIRQDARLIHVNVDDTSVGALGRWPWPRALDARVVETLHGLGVRAVVFDVFFPFPTSPQVDPKNENDPAFAKALSAMRNVYLASALSLTLAPEAETEEEEDSRRVMTYPDDLLRRFTAPAPPTLPLGLYYGKARLLPMEVFGQLARGIGHASATKDSDGGVRRNPLLVRVKDRLFPAMGFRVVLDLLESDLDRKSTRLNSSHIQKSRMPSSA